LRERKRRTRKDPTWQRQRDVSAETISEKATTRPGGAYENSWRRRPTTRTNTAFQTTISGNFENHHRLIDLIKNSGGGGRSYCIAWFSENYKLRTPKRTCPVTRLYGTKWTDLDRRVEIIRVGRKNVLRIVSLFTPTNRTACTNYRTCKHRKLGLDFMLDVVWSVVRSVRHVNNEQKQTRCRFSSYSKTPWGTEWMSVQIGSTH